MSGSAEQLSFDAHMQMGSASYGRGAYTDAIAHYNDAIGVAPSELEWGLALRDIASANGRLGRLDNAFSVALDAYYLHNQLLQATPEPNLALRREWAASSLYVAVSGLRCVLQRGGPISAEERNLPFKSARQAEKCFRAIEASTGEPDQYWINGCARISALETMLGNVARGRRLGYEAINIARRSEDRRLTTSNHSISPEERELAVNRATRRGYAAIYLTLFVGAGFLLNDPDVHKQADEVLC